MKRIWPLAALGIVTYLVLAIVTLPASVVLSRLPPPIATAGIEGTAWNGRAQIVQIGPTQVGSVSWKLRALPLFIGRLSVDLKVARRDGFVDTGLSMPLTGGKLTLTDLTASMPLSALPPSAAPGGWTGTINAKMAKLVLENGWPQELAGTADVLDLTGPARKPANIGSYKVIFPPDATGEELVGALSDQGGPLEIAGNIRLKRDRSYLIEGSIAARPEAGSSITDSLRFLGEPDAQGRRPFSLAGTM